MNKKRKKYLTVASIITIIASAFAMLTGLAVFALGSLVEEDVIKEAYKSDECIYYENSDGSYYFVDIDENGEEIVITQSDIKLMVRIVSTIIEFVGFITIGIAVAKLVLAIKILSLNGKNRYSKGCTIALLTLSVLNTNILESVFLIIAMCTNDTPEIEKPTEVQGFQPPDVIVK